MALMTLRAVPLLVFAVAVGCATMTSGYGSTLSGPEAVKFGWTSSGNASGCGHHTANATWSLYLN